MLLGEEVAELEIMVLQQIKNMLVSLTHTLELLNKHILTSTKFLQIIKRLQMVQEHLLIVI